MIKLNLFVFKRQPPAPDRCSADQTVTVQIKKVQTVDSIPHSTRNPHSALDILQLKDLMQVSSSVFDSQNDFIIRSVRPPSLNSLAV